MCSQSSAAEKKDPIFGCNMNTFDNLILLFVPCYISHLFFVGMSFEPLTQWIVGIWPSGIESNTQIELRTLDYRASYYFCWWLWSAFKPRTISVSCYAPNRHREDESHTHTQRREKQNICIESEMFMLPVLLAEEHSIPSEICFIRSTKSLLSNSTENAIWKQNIFLC